MVSVMTAPKRRISATDTADVAIGKAAAASGAVNNRLLSHYCGLELLLASCGDTIELPIIAQGFIGVPAEGQHLSAPPDLLDAARQVSSIIRHLQRAADVDLPAATDRMRAEAIIDPLLTKSKAVIAESRSVHYLMLFDAEIALFVSALADTSWGAQFLRDVPTVWTTTSTREDRA